MPDSVAGNSLQQVRSDFDRIAAITALDGEQPGEYSGFLLRHVPAGAARVLEVGCGLGAFSRLLAGRAGKVTALDLSPRMIEVARERSGNHPNIEFVLGDFLRLDLPTAAFDCVVTNATFHHLPTDEAVKKIKSLLRPGGVLVLHDILDSDGLLDLSLCVFRFPVRVAVRFHQTRRLRARRELREAYAEHGRHETYLKFREVLMMRDKYFPGAEAHRHLLWRYTIVWRKPV